MAEITVILTSYNKPKTVGAAIKSVLNQDFEDFELMIMDDNSNDETSDVIRKTTVEHNNGCVSWSVSGVKESERFKACRYAVNINEAINETDSKYITYISDDVVYHPNRLSTFYDFLENNPHKSVCFGGQEVVRLLPSGIFEGMPGNFLNQDTMNAACRIDHSSIMHRREIIENPKIRWQEGKEYWGNADAYFFKTLNEDGYKFFYVPGIYERQFITDQSVREDRYREGKKLYNIPWELEVDPNI